MDDLEHELAELLRQRATEVRQPSAMPYQLARRVRRRRVATGLTAALSSTAAIAVIAALLLPALLADVATRVESGGSRAQPHGSALAVTDEGLVVVSLDDGRRVRVLAHHRPGPGQTGRPGDIEFVSPATDGTYAYFQRGPGSGEGCDRGSEIHRVRVRGGPDERVAEGRNPALSPDGGKLAYVRERPGQGLSPADCAPDGVVVRDLKTGIEHLWPNMFPQVMGNFLELVWAPDSRHLYVEVTEDSGIFQGRLVDTDASGGSLLDAPVVRPLATFLPGGVASPVAFLSNGRLAFPASQGDNEKIASIDLHSPDPNGSTRELVRLPPGQVESLASDPTGTRLLIAEVPAPPSATSAGSPTRLYLWAAGRLRVITEGVSASVWLPGTIRTSAPTSAPVPSVLGLDETAARRRLAAVGFPIVETFVMAGLGPDGKYPPLVVTEQDPKPGVRLTKGRPVLVVFH